MARSSILIGGLDGCDTRLELEMANRHGLIAGATGTGKTVTLKTLVEGFSSAGVPVFVTDIKGDLSGLSKEGELNKRIQDRIDELELESYKPTAYPVIFWDLLGKRGHAVRTTISDMGPLLLSNLLELNDTQQAVMYICFKVADDQGLLLLDLKDLRALIGWVGENAKSLQRDYGAISDASLAAIQRALLMLEEQGADQFFGEPAVQLDDLMHADFHGNGVVSMLDATALMTKPKLYATFLLWLLAELFEQLPEVGDVEKPKLVLFFDEAHLLFKHAPKSLIEKVEQVVRLIRSKGVGVYFVTQTPADIPSAIAGQLGNRVQHALRAFTPQDKQAVKAAAETFRESANLDTERAITQLAVGEALVSVLDREGEPTPVERILIAPPQSRMGPLTEDERAAILKNSHLAKRYDTLIDRESAYEILKARAEQAVGDVPEKGKKAKAAKTRSEGEDILGAMAKSAARAVGSQLGQQVMRGLLGSLLGGRRR